MSSSKYSNTPDSPREPMKALDGVTPENLLGAILECYIVHGAADYKRIADVRPLWDRVETAKALYTLTYEMGAVAWGWTQDLIEIKAGWWDKAYENLPNWDELGAMSASHSREVIA